MENILRALYYNAKSRTRLVLYNIAEQGVLHLLKKNITGKTLDVQIAKLFDMVADSNRLSNRVLTLSSFMVPIATFVQRTTDPAIAGKIKIFAILSKIESQGATEVYSNIIKELTSRLDSESKEPDFRRSSRLRSENREAKHEDRRVKQHAH